MSDFSLDPRLSRRQKHLRPGNCRHYENTNDHGRLDLVCHEHSSQDTTAKDGNPELDLVRLQCLNHELKVALPRDFAFCDSGTRREHCGTAVGNHPNPMVSTSLQLLLRCPHYTTTQFQPGRDRYHTQQRPLTTSVVVLRAIDAFQGERARRI